MQSTLPPRHTERQPPGDNKHLVVERAGHATLQPERQDAQVTSAAIEQVVEAVRTDRPLPR